MPGIIIHETIFPPITGTQNLADGSLSLSTGKTQAFRLIAALIKFDGAVTQTATVTFDSETGASYDAAIKTVQISAGTSFSYAPNGGLKIPKGSNLTLTCANSGTPAVIAYATFILEDIV